MPDSSQVEKCMLIVGIYTYMHYTVYKSINFCLLIFMRKFLSNCWVEVTIVFDNISSYSASVIMVEVAILYMKARITTNLHREAKHSCISGLIEHTIFVNV